MKTLSSPLLGFLQYSCVKLMLILCTLISYEETALVISWASLSYSIMFSSKPENTMSTSCVL